MRLQVFLDEHNPVTLSELRDLLGFRREGGFGAFWLHDTGTSLGLLVAGDNACLYCMSTDGTPRPTWSHNPGYDGSDDDTTHFCLENGEAGDIPSDCVVPVDTACRVFEHFFMHGELSSEIEWC